MKQTKQENSAVSSPPMTTTEDRLRFAVRFVQMDLDAMRPGDWLNLRDDFCRFLMQKHGQYFTGEQGNRVTMAVKDGVLEVMDQPLIARGVMGLSRRATDLEDFTDDEFRALQRDVRVWFSELTDQSESRTPMFAVLGPVEVGFCPHFPIRFMGSPRDLFLGFLLVHLLAEPADRIRRCPECDRFFVRVKHQAYCTRVCGNRVTQRRWRAKHDPAPTAP